MRTSTIILLIFLLLMAASLGDPTAAFSASRFLFSGNGHIHLIGEKNGEEFSGRYRTTEGVYDDSAMTAICRVFTAPCDGPDSAVSLRFIEYLDYLQDRLNPEAKITIVSGYRSPVYNARIREQGTLAAKASLHQYGMAADLELEGVPSKTVWETVQELSFGGAGYYHGKTVHVDTGPARFWDETSSGVGTGLADDNKLIGLVTDFDIYRPGDAVALRFIRMTAFPIAVEQAFLLERKSRGGKMEAVASFIPSFSVPADGACPSFSDIAEMASIQFQLPEKLEPGSYAVSARFCPNPWTEMPEKVSTPEFIVAGPEQILEER
ncbi:MAG: DUF882 domain-containing protein [Desulfobacterales bacterium]|nr:DUF882 domain-containing protein [Desulfobacterales bacterium]